MHCVFHCSDSSNSQQLCLIYSRLLSCDPPKYDLKSLENDMIWAFILGKNKITEEGFRREFSFYERRSSLTLDLSVLDLRGVDITDEFKVT